MITEKHFDGQSNITAEGGTKSHLGQILVALIKDVTTIAGIAGIADIASADMDTVTATDASDLASLQALANEIKGDYNGGVTLSNEIRTALVPLSTVDISSAAAVQVTLSDATDEPTAVALVNAEKSRYNVLSTLLNEIKADLNTEGTVTISAADTAAEATADATDEASAITLANSLKANVNIAATLVNEIKSDLNAVPKLPLIASGLE